MEIIEEEVKESRHVRYGICPRCGRRVYLGGYMGMTECECGQWYNVFGQALKPPEDWDKEEF